MEHVSNGMFNAVISAGVSPRDSAIVELAAKVRDEFVGLAEAALAKCELTAEQLFDTDYVRVPGSNPERFRTSLCDWAAANLRPRPGARREGNKCVRTGRHRGMPTY